ncbi:hypothetical protein CAOG_07068 [Capsaspora owczarzaki ATCC 30864]|uniref:Uncharacterized protein n=1 Tax=Capsaspora owczarzaki (strain ATCC 30864) TaxID=595528 RepID=A0A0D2WWD6_CAPO3|nr:hypothetical protein CAOG_07068 [Capsaspora owczarzaki ATCC 30864]KJE96798.1 hypothetical protein CAOG_007068 [Capsaspora owczarzaki ATCC 30864]|eukprot:XP_004343792.1 hypothetical protein CAOG_07068 [Capsaspora owczarzaki ATCC 30864]
MSSAELSGWEASKPYRVLLYFVSLVICLVVCLWLCRNVQEIAQSKRRRLVQAYLAIALVALALTWYNILSFLHVDYARYRDVDAWLAKSEFMVNAYVTVSDTTEGWFWSSQLLLFTTVFIVMLVVQSRRHAQPVWHTVAYVWLGFGGAISVAFALFACRLQALRAVVKAPANGKKEPPTTRAQQTGTGGGALGGLSMVALTALILASVGSIFCFPLYAGTRWFKFHLLFVHLALALPAVLPAAKGSSSSSSVQTPSRSYILLLATIACLSLGHHLVLWRALLSGPGAFDTMTLLHAGFAHFCQAGISWDAVFVTLLATLFAGIESGVLVSASVFVGSVVLSPAVAFALFLIRSEMAQQQHAKKQ